MSALVSCLCVTRGRANLLPRAIGCFLEQTYENRELVILHAADDRATRDCIDRFRDARIRPITGNTPALTLGALRNIALDAAHGEYVATWDDDDWSASRRLEIQMTALAQPGIEASVLSKVTLYDAKLKQAFISQERIWEGTVVVRKAVLARFPELWRREDTAALAPIAAAGLLLGIDAPHLYVYVHHGSNASGRVHWKRHLVRWATPLGADEAQAWDARLGRYLGGEIGA